MSFDRPAFLWAFLALAPLLAAFLVRRKRVRFVVPDLEAWLAAVEAKRARPGWRRIRDAGSLALNLLAAGALAVAAAGPRAAVAPGTDWALVFDVSASMAARDGRWAKSLDEADAFARSLPARDRFRVFLAGDVPRAIGGWRSGGEALPDIPLPGDRTGDVEGALKLVASDPAVRPGALKTVAWTDGEAAATFAPRVAGEADNLAIEAIDAARAWGSAKVEVVLRVENHGRVSAKGEVALGCGASKGSAPYDLAPGAAATLRATLEAPEGGALEARLPTGDALAADDAAFVAVPPLKRARVLVVAPGAKSAFLSSALAALAPSLDAASGLVEPGGAVAADVFICDRCEAPSLPAVRIAAPSAAAEVENPAVTAWAADHPLFRGLDLSRLRVARARPLPRNPGETVLIDSAAGPLAVAGDRSVTLGFALEDTNLPLLAAFPLFVRNAVEELSRVKPLPSVKTGDWVEPFAGSYEAWAAGRAETAAGPWRAERPGVAVFTRDGVSRPVAVNFFDPAESALAKPPPGRELPVVPGEPLPPWTWIAAAAALVLAIDWAVVSRPR